jgi:hypothetical protein
MSCLSRQSQMVYRRLNLLYQINEFLTELFYYLQYNAHRTPDIETKTLLFFSSFVIEKSFRKYRNIIFAIEDVSNQIKVKHNRKDISKVSVLLKQVKKKKKCA